MKTRGYVHQFITSFIFMSAAAIALKGFFAPENTALLLLDTGLLSAMYVDPIAFALPLALSICAMLAFYELVSLVPVVVCFALYTVLSGIAIQQGLNIDCGCNLPGSLESIVYSEIEPQFFIYLIITLMAGALHLFNARRPIQTTAHPA